MFALRGSQSERPYICLCCVEPALTPIKNSQSVWLLPSIEARDSNRGWKNRTLKATTCHSHAPTTALWLCHTMWLQRAVCRYRERLQPGNSRRLQKLPKVVATKPVASSWPELWKLLKRRSFQ